MTDLELAVRTIEDILPEMPTAGIQKWLAILNTAAMKCEAELNSTIMHQCTACGFEEYGYRTELPVGWRGKYDTQVCFNHTEKEVDSWLQKPAPVEATAASTEESLEDLMALL